VRGTTASRDRVAGTASDSARGRPALLCCPLLLVLAALTLRCAAPVAPPEAASLTDAPAMAAAVRAELLHAWSGYERYAWGHDELRPLSRSGRDWYGSPLLLTPVDALDTLILVGLDDEAAKAREAVAAHLRFDRPLTVQVFEVTIRVLGGLLSAYQLTGDRRLLGLAEDLGERLLPAFDSPTGMPYRYVDLATGTASGAESNPAEIGTLILEFGTLAKLTGREVFYERAKRALVEVYRRRAPTGLVGEKIDVETGDWTSRRSLVGARIDSYYEYLLKCQRLFGDADCGAMWRASREAIDRYLADDGPDGLWYGEADMTTGERTATVYGALHAFLPGLLALDGDLDRARRLQESGLRMWRLHGIEPEAIDYRSMEVVEDGYPLRPEIVESAYVLHALTGDPRYREMGRIFFSDLRRWCRTDAGYTVLDSVVSKKQGDLMPSYFLAETLKYLYLLYAPDALDFRSVVFTTEAHPLRRTW
jgi:Glycosyl hydrolase family 47